MIPKIIHQTAQTMNLTWEERRLQKRAKKLMPDYQFILYDDEKRQKFVEAHFPQYAERFRNIAKGVCKADVARLMFLYICGGWYCDTDYKWILPPPLTLVNKKCVLGISRENMNPMRIGNAVFGSEPGVDFWKDFIDHIFTSTELSDIKENRIEKVTGPEGLTDFYWANKDKYDDIYLAPREVLLPLLTPHAYKAYSTKDTVGIHLCWGSWRTSQISRRIKNWLRRKITAII